MVTEANEKPLTKTQNKDIPLNSPLFHILYIFPISKPEMIRVTLQ